MDVAGKCFGWFVYAIYQPILQKDSLERETHKAVEYTALFFFYFCL